MDWASGFARWPALETERLVLRRLRMDDAPDVFEYSSDPQVAKFVLFEAHGSIADTEEFLGRVVARNPEESGLATFGVVLKESGKLIGTCGIFLDHVRSGRAEMAYMLNRAYWGRGLMTEAVRAVIDFGFSKLGLNRIAAFCMVDNAGSARVMEKVGMKYEGILREYMLIKGHYTDLKVYAILRREWEGPARHEDLGLGL